jgi:hypothetical protein
VLRADSVRSIRSGVAATLTALVLVACAPEVSRRPTSFTPLAEQPAATIEVLQDQKVSASLGYDRVIGRGTQWTLVGRSIEGDVYKPVGRVFTVEGGHIHEAYLVIAGDRVVGFYLPVERAFAPVREGPTPLSIRRRQP